MEHLYNSRVEVLRLSRTAVSGRPVYSYDVVQGLEFLPCRLDLNFLRPGKDVPMATEAGKAPDRIGVMFCAQYTLLPEGDWVPSVLAGDRVRAVENEYGQLPVPGTFEIRTIPDVAQDYASGHHIEVQIVEVAKAVAEDSPRKWPT